MTVYELFACSASFGGLPYKRVSYGLFETHLAAVRYATAIGIDQWYTIDIIPVEVRHEEPGPVR